MSVHWVSPPYPTDGEDAESLFKNAEAALKQAKVAGERYSYYSPEFNAPDGEKIEWRTCCVLPWIWSSSFSTTTESRSNHWSYLRCRGFDSMAASGTRRGAAIEFIALAERQDLFYPLVSGHSHCRRQQALGKRSPLALSRGAEFVSMQFKKGNVQESVRRR